MKKQSSGLPKIDLLWPALLACRASFAEENPGARAWIFSKSGPDDWRFATTEEPLPWSISDQRIVCDLDSTYPDYDDRLGLGGHYLHLLHGLYQARREGRFYITAHFAQSIDGRIATPTGDSQWIGNEANLLHAHRLRALHDGILVGANTVRRDQPNLTVRHCEGENPTRVILAGRNTIDASAFAGLDEGAPSWVLTNRPEEDHPEGNLEWISLPGHSANEVISVAGIIACLQERGLGSLMIEGGSFTVSQFLAAGALDTLEIHVAPIVLGSGVPSLRLPEIDRLREAPQFKLRQFDLEGEPLYCLSPS